MKTVKEKRVIMKKLVASSECVPIPGAFDALTAKLVERAGFQAVYIGSFSMSASLLGYPDTGILTMNDMITTVDRIANVIDIPLIADAENGWYNAANIWRTVRDLERAGAAGFHIEDHEFGKHTKLKGQLYDCITMCDRIKACVDSREDENFLVIARSDATHLLGNPEVAVERLEKYVEAGADMVFMAGASIEQLKKYHNRFKAPLCTTPSNYGPIPSLQEETEAGAAISLYWPLLTYTTYRACTDVLAKFKKVLDYEQLGEYRYNEPDINTIIPLAKFEDRVKKYNVTR